MNQAQDLVALDDPPTPHTSRELLVAARKAHAASPTPETAMLVTHFESALEQERGESENSVSVNICDGISTPRCWQTA